jgi:hypothetical protein
MPGRSNRLLLWSAPRSPLKDQCRVRIGHPARIYEVLPIASANALAVTSARYPVSGRLFMRSSPDSISQSPDPANGTFRPPWDPTDDSVFTLCSCDQGNLTRLASIAAKDAS